MILEYSIPGRAGIGIGMALNLAAMGVYNWQQLVAKRQAALTKHIVPAMHHLAQNTSVILNNSTVHISPVMHQAALHSAALHPGIPTVHGAAWVPVIGIVANLITGFGCMNYAKAKAQKPLLGVFGALPPFGMIGLAIVCVLPDKSKA